MWHAASGHPWAAAPVPVGCAPHRLRRRLPGDRWGSVGGNGAEMTAAFAANRNQHIRGFALRGWEDATRCRLLKITFDTSAKSAILIARLAGWRFGRDVELRA